MNSVIAAKKIENYYICYRNKHLFKLLKMALCAAELSLSEDLLKKVSPVEADFFKNDPCMKFKIKFRFGGHDFPPRVYYKIYLSPTNCVARQVSTKEALYRSDAAREGALRNMGHSKYLSLLMEDACQTLGRTITDKDDVVSRRDYIQLCSYMDEMPANHGGKNNPWKKLDQTILSRHSPVYDVFEYLNTKTMSKTVKEMLCRGFYREKLEFQIALASNAKVYFTQKKRKKNKIYNTSRRKHNSVERAERMQQLYLRKVPDNCEHRSEDKIYNSRNSIKNNEKINIPFMACEEDWEDDAQELYEWTQELNSGITE